jgi:hypothetical protein
VHLADALVSAVDPDEGAPGVEHRLDVGFLDGCGIAPDLGRWTQWAREEVKGTVAHGAK